MKLWQFVHQTTPSLFYLALLVSFFSGLSNAAIASMISQHITGQGLLNNWFIGTFALLLLLAICLDFIAKQALSLLMNTMIHELRMSFTSQALTAAYPHLETVGATRLFALLTEDTRAIGQVVVELPPIAIGLATIVGCMAYLAWLSPLALLGLGLLTLPIFVAYGWLQKHESKMLQQLLLLRNQLFALYRDLTDGMKELKLHQPRLAAFYHTHLQPIAVESRAISIRCSQYHFFAQSVNQFTYFVIILGLFIISHWLPIAPAVLGGYAVMILYLKTATTTIVSTLPRWGEAQTVIEQVEELGFRLMPPVPIANATIPLASAPQRVQIDLQDVIYHYHHPTEEHSFQLGPLQCRLQSGEIVFIIGGNGSGKTTLLKLLIGLYTPQAGKIFCNGADITTECLESYRQNFAVLFAEPYLFAHLMGLNWDTLDQRAQAWLQRLQLAHKVKISNGQLSTLNLSFGQRKRLALLTAYLEERAIYIFDEWAAGQDPEFRELFYRSLLPELKQQGKLVVVISHDDHYFDSADRVIKLDSGRIEYDIQQN